MKHFGKRPGREQPETPRRKPRAPRGFLLLELLGAAFLLGVALVLTARLVGSIALQERALERRAVAAREVANVMERTAALPWDELGPKAAAATRLSPVAERALPRARLKLDISPEQDPLVARRILVELRWGGAAGIDEAPVRLVTWVYRAGRAQP